MPIDHALRARQIQRKAASLRHTDPDHAALVVLQGLDPDGEILKFFSRGGAGGTGTRTYPSEEEEKEEEKWLPSWDSPGRFKGYLNTTFCKWVRDYKQAKAEVEAEKREQRDETAADKGGHGIKDTLAVQVSRGSGDGNKHPDESTLKEVEEEEEDEEEVEEVEEVEEEEEEKEGEKEKEEKIAAGGNNDKQRIIIPGNNPTPQIPPTADIVKSVMDQPMIQSLLGMVEGLSVVSNNNPVVVTPSPARGEGYVPGGWVGNHQEQEEQELESLPLSPNRENKTKKESFTEEDRQIYAWARNQQRRRHVEIKAAWKEAKERLYNHKESDRKEYM